MIPFWQRVRSLLDEELTQAWLCREIGVSTATMSSWITNKRIPRGDMTLRIADALGVSVHYLIDGYDKNNKEDQPSWIQVLRHAIKDQGYIRTPNKREYQLDEKDEVELIPLFEQVVSAGHGADLLDQLDPLEYLPIPKQISKQYDTATLLAVTVRGDSMEGIYIYDGDYVIFSKGLIKGDGIYVLTVHGEILVKRLAFDQVHKKMHIYSENPKYPDRTTIDITSEDVRIEGLVVAWFHINLR